MTPEPTARLVRREGFANEITLRQHTVVADEPADTGGTDTGPKPTELLAAALAGCTAITIELYAQRKEWEIGQVEVDVALGEASDGESPRFDVGIRIPATLEEDQRQRIETIAGKCPVARLLQAEGTEVVDSVTLSS